MLVVRIEEWPGGDGDRRRPIELLRIANLTHLAQISDYEITRDSDGKRVFVYKHPRQDGWPPLVLQALHELMVTP